MRKLYEIQVGEVIVDGQPRELSQPLEVPFLDGKIVTRDHQKVLSFFHRKKMHYAPLCQVHLLTYSDDMKTVIDEKSF